MSLLANRQVGQLIYQLINLLNLLVISHLEIHQVNHLAIQLGNQVNFQLVNHHVIQRKSHPVNLLIILQFNRLPDLLKYLLLVHLDDLLVIHLAYLQISLVVAQVLNLR